MTVTPNVSPIRDLPSTSVPPPPTSTPAKPDHVDSGSSTESAPADDAQRGVEALSDPEPAPDAPTADALVPIDEAAPEHAPGEDSTQAHGHSHAPVPVGGTTTDAPAAGETEAASESAVEAQSVDAPAPAPSPARSPMVSPVDPNSVLPGGQFGERDNIGGVNLLPNGKEMHHGVDYSVPEGTPIVAAADGTVIVAETNPYGGGLEVVIDHGVDDQGKPVFSRYLHQSAIETAVGAQVKQGERIGLVGSTGNTTGAHLHFEVSNAFTKHDWSKETVDPNVYISGARTLAPGEGATPAPTQAPTQAPAAPTKPTSDATYTVQPGETLGAIALKHGTTWTALSAANADTIADPNLIHPGDKLRLPAAPVSPPASATYVVQPGDSLSAIAAREGVSLDALIEANRALVGANPDLIQVGATVVVPRGDVAVAAAPAAGAPAAPAAPSGVGAARPEIDAFIATAAAAYGADAGVLGRIAELESSYDTGDIMNDWDINAINGTPSRGMFQFIQPTFEWLQPMAQAANPEAWSGMGTPNWTDWRQQALTTAWAITNGYGPHWATYARAGGA
ncbi:MAG: peptidase [Thermoleophilia bacterium]|nr:peptidase [Thermoleophilia bacterium]